MVVPYIGTWIETQRRGSGYHLQAVVPYIGTWIETHGPSTIPDDGRRTLYRYVD